MQNEPGGVFHKCIKQNFSQFEAELCFFSIAYISLQAVFKSDGYHISIRSECAIRINPYTP
jgi:hypothetical protein